MVVPGRLADRAQPLDRPVLGGEPPGAGDLLVEDRARGVEGERRTSRCGSPLLSVLTSAPGMPAASAVIPIAVRSACDRAPRAALGLRSARLVRPVGLGLRAPGRRHVALVGVGAQRRSASSRIAEIAVDEGVVGLGVHRDPAVAQSLDDVRLPQRPLPGQPGAVQPGAELEQLADPPRLGQRAVADVVLDVELLVRPPHQLPGGPERAVGMLEEQRRDLLDVAHLLVHLAHVAAARALRLLEQLEAADVHRHVAVLGEQERGRRRIDRGDHVCAPSRRASDPCRLSRGGHKWNSSANCAGRPGAPLPFRSDQRRGAQARVVDQDRSSRECPCRCPARSAVPSPPWRSPAVWSRYPPPPTPRPTPLRS